MGRYYDLTISNPDNGQVWKLNALGGFMQSPGGTTFSSLMPSPTGGPMIDNPGALQIEFDIPVTAFNAFQGGALIRVHGIGLGAIGQASNLNGQLFQLNAGMSAGLPLANPLQNGLVLSGQIFQAFGNWQGTEQTIDLICNPGDLIPPNGVNFTWAPGTSLAGALFTTFSQAFPTYTKPKINIVNDMQPPMSAPQYGCYKSLGQFSEYLHELTQPLGAKVTNNDSYSGVMITIVGKQVFCNDNLTESFRTVPLAFVDLIGQPTWIAAATITFKTVLRADIAVGNDVKFPQGITPAFALTTPAAAKPGAPARDNSAFQGTFRVTEIHHFASSRQPDAESWNTTFTAQINTG